MFLARNRATGPYAPMYWALWTCNVFIPQALWLKRVRQNPVLLFFLSIIINIGMWFERFVIIVLSLNRDFLPSAWGLFRPTIIDVGTFTGT